MSNQKFDGLINPPTSPSNESVPEKQIALQQTVMDAKTTSQTIDAINQSQVLRYSDTGAQFKTTSGQHKLTNADNVLLLEIKHGSRNGDVVVKAKTQKICDNLGGIAPSTYTDNTLAALVNKSGEAQEGLLKAMSVNSQYSQKDIAEAVLSTNPKDAPTKQQLIQSGYSESQAEQVGEAYNAAAMMNRAIGPEILANYSQTESIKIRRQAELIRSTKEVERLQAILEAKKAAGKELTPEEKKQFKDAIAKGEAALEAYKEAEQAAASNTYAVTDRLVSHAANNMGAGVGFTTAMQIVFRWIAAPKGTSIFTILYEYARDQLKSMDLVSTVIKAIGTITGLPLDTINKITTFAKDAWENGLSVEKILDMVGSITVNGESITEPKQIQIQYDGSSIAAMIKSVFAAGLAPFEFVDSIMAKVEGFVNNPILLILLALWYVLSPESQNCVLNVVNILDGIDSTCKTIRSGLKSIMTSIAEVGDKVVEFVDKMFKEALKALINGLNIGLDYLQPVMSYIPISAETLLRPILSMFLNSPVLGITITTGVPASSLKKAGMNNLENVENLKKNGKELDSNTQPDRESTPPSTTKPKEIKQYISLVDDRPINLSVPSQY